MRIGFTGTQNGMTKAQKSQLWNSVTDLTPSSIGGHEFRHGDCVGADEQAHLIVHNT